MEKLIAEIEAYSIASGTTPQLILKNAGGYGWGVWAKWKSGKSQCTLTMAEKIRAYIQNRDPSLSPALSAASDEGSCLSQKRKSASSTVQDPAKGAA